MSDKNDSFTANPFLGLDSSKYPVARRGGASGEKYPTVPDEEAILFLRAMGNPAFFPEKPQKHGFSMADICKWPFPANSMKKRKKKIPVKEEVQKNYQPPETDDAEAFMLAMRNAQPLSGKGRAIVPGRPDFRGYSPPEPTFEEMLQSRLEFALFYSDEYLEGKVAGLDELVMNRLRQGRMTPEAHLDLHGLNAIQAFEALRIFIRDCWFKDLRVVLIITGRGRNSLLGHSVLRQKLRIWLTQEPFNRVVLAFCTARPHDGGPGSVYVLLRRFRKKGRPQWDRMPADPDLYD